MNISQRGLNLIYEFEGKLVRLPDGRFKAYRCPAGVPTIYAGCTVGVTMGMIVTEDEGEAMFRGELARFERCVLLACTREPNQNQFDAFVALAYNIGESGFRGSGVLRHFNAGNDDKAAKAFAAWNKATVKGRKVVLRGLTRRRAAEAGLFMRPVDPPVAPEMPQKVDEPSNIVATAGKVAGGAGLGTGGYAVVDPVGFMSNAVAVKSSAQQLFAGVDLATLWFPFAIVGLAVGLLVWAGRRSV